MARSAADIALTLGISPEYDARRIADEMTRGFKQAGNQAGIDYNESLTRQIDQLPPKVARAMRKTAAALGQVDEATAKVSSRYYENRDATEALAKANEELAKVNADVTASEEDKLRAMEAATAAQDRYNASTRALISERAKLGRANQATASSLSLVNTALIDIGNEQSAGQTLLTVGKYISAIRAAAIPAFAVLGAATFSAVASSASALSYSLWMIPAAAAAAASGVGAVKIATLGFSDAVENMGDPEKFYEALQNLSPNAQQAALAIQALTEPLKALKNATQDAFFADVGPMLNQLAQQYLPMVQQLTTGIGGAFNSAFKSIFDQLMTDQTQAVLQDTINNLVSAFERLAPAAGPFVDAITRIVQTGSQYLPGMADAIANAATEFATFIETAQNSGDLDRWFQLGIKAAGEFWEILKVLGKAFIELAPAGIKALEDIKKTIEALTPPVVWFMNNLGMVLFPIAAISDAATKMYNVVAPIFERIADYLDRFGKHPLLNIAVPGLALANAAFGGMPRSSSTPAPFPGGGMGAPGGGSWGDMFNRIFGKVGPAAPGSYRTRDGKVRPLPGRTGGLNIPGLPDGGYPLPPPPPEKGSKGKKADEPPFAADPSAYSLDSIPLGSFFGDAGTGAPLAAEAAPLVPMEIPDLTRANRQIDALAAIASTFNLSNASDVRNEPGSWHHVGQAGDFSNSSGPTPEMHAFAMYMAQNFGSMIEELIYSDPVRGDVLIGGGQVVGPGTDQPNYYDAATRAGHMNHVHIAVTDAMAPFLEAAMQGNMFGGFGAGGMNGMPYSGYVSVDQEKIDKAVAARDQAARTVEEKRLAYLKLQQSGDADQLQLLRAKNDVIDAENSLIERERVVAEARMGTYKELDTNLQSSAKNVKNGLGQIGAALVNDFGISEGLPGIAKWVTTFLANLAFAPMVGALSGISAVGSARSGTTGASGLIGMLVPPVEQMDASAMGPNPLGGGVGAPLPGQAQNMPAAQNPLLTLPVMKYDSGGMLPPGGIGINTTTQPEPVLTPEQWAQVTEASQPPQPIGQIHMGGGQLPGPAVAPEQGGDPTAPTSRTPWAGIGGGGFGGIGGMPMAAVNQAIQLGALALDSQAPGAGQAAAAAAQIGIQLANRTAGFWGQAAAIGVGGLMETFLPNNSEVADPAKSWLGRIAGGLSGARPAVPNSAGSPAPAQKPPPQQAGGAPGGPLVNVENLVNNTPDGGQDIARQISRMQMSSYSSGGPR